MLTGLMAHPYSYIMSVYVRDLTNLNHYTCIYISDKPLDITNRHYTIFENPPLVFILICILNSWLYYTIEVKISDSLFLVLY